MSLQDDLDALRRDFEAKAPPQAVAIMHRATADLAASGQAARALKAGDAAPPISIPDADGRVVRSADLLANGPLVVTFYRGIWCPYCNLDLKALEARAGDIRAYGASLIAISPQTQANGRKTQADLTLSFPVLSDQGGAVSEAFGLRYALPADLLALYKDFGVDLASVNGDVSGTLPMPARLVIDRSGVIAYAEVSPDYTRRPDPGVLLPVLDRLRASSAA